METIKLDMSEVPECIKYGTPPRKTIYYVPLVFKQGSDDKEYAYVAMYARQYERSGIKRYRMDEYLFRVEGKTLEQTLERFIAKLQSLQQTGVIKGNQLRAEVVRYTHIIQTTNKIS